MLPNSYLGFCLAGLLLASQAWAERDPLDPLERRLETARHERLLQSMALPGSALNAFTTDGCSGGLSAGWEYLAQKLPAFRDIHGVLPPWQDCCIEHDRAYHSAVAPATDASASFTARKQADLQLRACVLQTGISRSPELSTQYGLSRHQVLNLYAVVANLMYRAVRLGGVPCSGLPWRWGYGWPPCD